jgi:hypothetical protein
MKAGKIPQRVKLYCRPETTISYDRWSDVGFKDTLAEDVKAIPTFVVDASNPKTQETAQYWVNSHKRVWCPTEEKYIDNTTIMPIVVRDNTPVDSVRIIGLSVRGNGGRAYQALVDEKYLVDMREDVMLDSMLHVGIDVNGIMRGQYIFAQVNSEMKLIRMDSKLHELMVQSTAFSNAKAVSQLVPGHIYESKTKKVLYLGELWHVGYEVDRTKHGWNYSYVVKILPSVKKHAYVVIDYDSENNMKDVLDKNVKWPSDLEILKTPSKAFKTDHGAVNDFDVSEAVNIIREKIENMLDNKLEVYNLNYYNALNLSTVSGYIHPKLQK